MIPLYAQILAHLLVVYALLIEPLLGDRKFRELHQSVAEGDPNARSRFYRMILAIEWAWVVIIGMIVLTAADPWGSLGLNLPQTPFAWGMTGAIFFGIAIGSIFSIIAAKKHPELVQQQLEPISAMLPQSPSERRQFAAVSITAGLCEELLFRAFLFFYFMELWALPIWVAIILSSVIFGIAHAYQGLKGIMLTGTLGLGFAGLYAVTGSLIPCIIVHALIDLRILLLIPPANTAAVYDNNP